MINKSVQQKEKKEEENQELCQFLGHVKYFDEKTDRIQKEVEAHNWKIFGILFVTISLILTVAGWQIYSSATSKAISHVTTLVQERLDEEFSNENIQLSIEQAAKKYTENEVDNIVAEQIRIAVGPFVEEAKSPFDGLVNIIELRGLSKLGDKKAYFDLVEIAKGNSIFSSIALADIYDIQREFISLYYIRDKGVFTTIETFHDKNGAIVDMEQLNVADLFKHLDNADHTPNIRLAFMLKIKSKGEEVYSEALKILNNSQNLHTLVATTSVLSELIGYEADFFEFEEWIEILKKQ